MFHKGRAALELILFISQSPAEQINTVTVPARRRILRDFQRFRNLLKSLFPPYFQDNDLGEFGRELSELHFHELFECLICRSTGKPGVRINIFVPFRGAGLILPFLAAVGFAAIIHRQTPDGG